MPLRSHHCIPVLVCWNWRRLHFCRPSSNATFVKGVLKRRWAYAKLGFHPGAMLELFSDRMIAQVLYCTNLSAHCLSPGQVHSLLV